MVVLLSIIVPTYCESGSMRKTVARIRNSLEEREYEIIVVDDKSNDGTAKIAKQLGVKVIEVNYHDYSKSVAHGIREAKGGYICVTDGDGQKEVGQFKNMEECLSIPDTYLYVEKRWCNK